MMKNILFILILFCVATRIYGQAYDKVKVPLVKESKKIDSLLDEITTTIDSKSYFFLIHVTCSGNFNNFFIEGIKNNFPSIDLPAQGKFKNGERTQFYQGSIKCFIHKGIIAFIEGNDLSCLNLFKNTNRSKSFLFKRQDLKSFSIPKGSIVFTGIYEYQNGRFEPNIDGQR